MYNNFKVGDVVTLNPECFSKKINTSARFTIKNIYNGFEYPEKCYYCINIFSNVLDIEGRGLIMAEHSIEVAYEQFNANGVVVMQKDCKKENVVVELWSISGALYKSRYHYTGDYHYRNHDLPNVFKKHGKEKKQKMDISAFESEVRKYLELGYKIL